LHKTLGKMGEDQMLYVMSRICRLFVVCSAIVSIGSLQGTAQDPPVGTLNEAKESVPVPNTPPDVSSDDPIMKAIRERAALVPANGPKPSNPSDTPSPATRRSASRWHIAERLLRQARILERDADSLEQLGDTDAADSLRQLAATTREQVIRILQTAAKPLDEKREPNLPLKRAIP
jgi:hypothetical protein